MGLSASAVRTRVAAGRLHRVHGGVVSVCHPDLLSRCGRFMAAALACGDGAALDVAEHVSRREIERAIDRAEILRTLDMRPIHDVLARANGRKGAAALRSVVMSMRLRSTLTRSELEERFLRICRDAGHPPDGVNVWIPYPEGGGAEADFVWHEARRIIEVDGRDVHTTRHAFEHDRKRDQRLNLLGWRVVRFTWRQVEHEAQAVAATVAALLG